MASFGPPTMMSAPTAIPMGAPMGQQAGVVVPRRGMSTGAKAGLVIVLLLFLLAIVLSILYGTDTWPFDGESAEETKKEEGEGKGENDKEETSGKSSIGSFEKDSSGTYSVQMPTYDTENFDLDEIESALKCSNDKNDDEKCADDKKAVLKALRESGPMMERLGAETKEFVNLLNENDKTTDDFKVQQERLLALAGSLERNHMRIEKRQKDVGAEDVGALNDRLDTMMTTFGLVYGLVNDTGRKDGKGCLLHATKSIGDIVCPRNFTTFYLSSVHDAADCEKDADEGLCNRCIGNYQPKKRLGRPGQWNDNEWKVHKSPATGASDGKGGSVMSYSGTYVADGHSPEFSRC